MPDNDAEKETPYHLTEEYKNKTVLEKMRYNYDRSYEIDLRFNYYPGRKRNKSNIEKYLEFIGGDHKPNSFASGAHLLLGSKRTIDLTADEIIEEYKIWTSKPGTGAVRVDNGYLVEFKYKRNGFVSFTRSNSMVKSSSNDRMTEGKAMRLFADGTMVLEDGPRDPGGFGGQWAYDRLIQMTTFMMIGKIDILSDIDKDVDKEENMNKIMETFLSQIKV